jgi:hypothetical protein
VRYHEHYVQPDRYASSARGEHDRRPAPSKSIEVARIERDDYTLIGLQSATGRAPLPSNM